MSETGQVTARGLANLFIVYLVWVSTYLAIRVAVRPGAGVPPFTLGFVRMLSAGLVLLLWGYLIVFGSIIAFTAYVSIVRELPTSLAMTFAYVNPVIAVLLGAGLLSEEVRENTLIGGGMAIVGVVIVFREKMSRR